MTTEIFAWNHSGTPGDPYIATIGGQVILGDALTLAATNRVGASATIEGVTAAEFAQLANIDSATISSTQWGYVGDMDQGVTTTSTVSFTQASATTLVGGTLTLSTNTISSSAVNTDITVSPNGTGRLLLNGLPTSDNHAATKAYVDSVASGLTIKDACMLATTVDFGSNASVSSLTYDDDGGASARGQFTGTLAVSDTLTIDGVTIGAANDGARILVKNQTNADENGIWTTTISGTSITLDRATDFDQDAEVTDGCFTFIEQGGQASTGWVLTTNNPITVGGASGTDLVFVQFSGSGSFVAGDGLTLTGNTFDVVGSTTIFAAANSIYVNSSATANQILLSAGSVGTQATFGALPLGDSNSVTGTLAAANGGTGQNTYTAGDLLYASGATTLSKLAAGTSTQVLHGGATPSWGAVSLTADVSGTLPVANGGTGVTSSTGTGSVVLSTSPVLTTPTLGIASATSINGVTITSSTGTVSLANSSTLTTVGAFNTTFTSTATTSLTLPTSGTLLSTDSTYVASVTGTTDRITIGGTATNPTVDIASTYAGQSSIVTVGTLTGGATGAGFTVALGASTITGVLDETNGGTGQSTLTTGDFLYASAADTFSKRAIGTAGQLLTVSGGVPTWATYTGTTDVVTLGTITTGTWNADTVAIAYGGTGITTAATPGAVVYGASSTTLGYTAAGTAGNILISGGAGSPTWGASYSMTSTASTVAQRDSNANLTSNSFISGYTTTTTAAGTTVLTGASTQIQYFTGTTTETVTLPVTSTLVLGQKYEITNKSTGDVTIQSSGANTVVVLSTGETATVTCILTSGTTAASWHTVVTTPLSVATFSAGSTGFTPSTATDGAITLAGTLNISNGGTGITTAAVPGAIVYGASSTTLGYTAAGTSGQVLLSGGTGSAVWGFSYTSDPTASTIMSRDANANVRTNNFIENQASTTTAGATTTLTVASARQQYFTGTTTQTVVLPVVSTLTLGHKFEIVNRSTGNVTVESSGNNTVVVLTSNQSVFLTCVLTSGTTAASWFYQDQSVSSVTTLSFGSTGLTPGTATSGAITVAGTLVAANGGTGQSSYTAGDILYASGASALSKLAAGTSTQVLHGGSTPSWGAVSLTADVTGVLGAANGGTGVANTNTITLGGNIVTAGAFSTSGSFPITLTATASTSVTLPTSGTIISTDSTYVSTISGTANQITVTGTTNPTLSFSNGVTGTATSAIVLATSPTLVTPILGAATATSINKVTITAPATSSTLTVADGKALTVSNTLTLTGTDSSSVNFGSGGSVTYTSNNLSVFAATTSAQLAGVISDETGSGSLVFGTSPTLTSPTLVTPTLGVSSGTSISLSAATPITCASIGSGVGTMMIVDSSGNLLKAASSRRWKTDITDLEIDSSKLHEMKPRSFTWNEDKGGHRDIGFIAEEVNEIIPMLVPKDSEGRPESVHYALISVMLVAEVKKLKVENDALMARLAAIEAKLA